jgi:hypothetical protein
MKMDDPDIHSIMKSCGDTMQFLGERQKITVCFSLMVEAIMALSVSTSKQEREVLVDILATALKEMVLDADG